MMDVKEKQNCWWEDSRKKASNVILNRNGILAVARSLASSHQFSVSRSSVLHSKSP
jgi:hypothetical protein